MLRRFLVCHQNTLSRFVTDDGIHYIEKDVNKLNILVACEESQRVCMEFRKLGHKAFSCDIEPCSGGHPEWHIQDDVLPLLNGNCNFKTMNGEMHHLSDKWDMIIAFPPCTYLTNAGLRHFSKKWNTQEKIDKRLKLRKDAAVFFMIIANANCNKIAIENPAGYMNTHFRKPDQIIHPYYFAKNVDDVENYQMKRTCLWLKGLPILKKVSNLPKPLPKYYNIDKNGKKKNRYWCESMLAKGGQKERAKARSKTFPGVAKAMAEQWGGKLN